MSKHIHRIIINKEKKYTSKYIYNYGNTKDICVKIAKDYISIEVELTKMYDYNFVLSNSNYLFADAIKKALLIYIINYSENINIKTMSIMVDNEIDYVINNKYEYTLPISSLIVGKLRYPFKNKFNNDEVRGILSQTKSSSDSRLASLMAFSISKSKNYESERFIYLWMAFNGMYSYFSKLVEDVKKTNLNMEFKQIMAIQMLLGTGVKTLNKIEKSRIAHEIISLIRHYKDTDITKESLEYGKDRELALMIEEKLVNKDTNEKYNITAYGYLITQFSYYFRCKFIHASKPISLFSYSDDIELKCLKIINNLLEEFIESNLHKWFDKEYTNILRENISQFDISLFNKK